MRKAVLATALSALTLLPSFAVADTSTISGSAWYRERIALPPGAVLEVSLQDVSLADAAAPVLSSQRFAMSGVPHAFDLNYDPGLIDERFSYSVSARIIVDGQVLFRTTSHNAVLSRGAGNEVDLMLTKERSAGVVAKDGSGRTPDFSGTGWVVFELRGETVEAETLPTLQFGTDGRVAAYAGCNRFSGGFEQDQGSLSFSQTMAGTMMACPPPFDSLEREFIAALGQVSSLSAGSDEVVLTDADGATVMKLRPSD